MKKSVILILLLLPAFLFGQNNYEVFNFTNRVMIKHRASSEWINAKKGMTLGFLDSVSIGNSSDIRIHDMRTNEVYRFSKSGSFRVKDIRDAAKSQSANIISAMYSQIAKQDGSESGMNMVGATTRGENSDDLAAIAQSIVCIAKKIEEGKHSFDAGFALISHLEDGVLSFTLQNHTQKDYCINVVMCDFQKQKVSLCYVISPSVCDYPYLLLPSGESIDLEEWHFIPASATQRYFLIATEEVYDTEQLQHILTRLSWDTLDDKETFSLLTANSN